MNSPASSRLCTIFICMCFFFVFFQYTFSQPISTNILNNHDGQHASNSLWIRPTFDEEFGPWSSEDNKNSNEENAYNRASLSSPVRRSNFWKRANFWRKRSNFWRRDAMA